MSSRVPATKTRYLLREPGEMWTGPFTVDAVANMLATGKLSSRAEVCLDGEDDWRPLAEVNPEWATASKNSSARYANLLAVSGSMRSFGGLLRVLALVVGVLAVVGGVVAGGMPGVILGMAFGTVVGVSLYAAGMMIAAMGEGLLALADIATNTAPRG